MSQARFQTFAPSTRPDLTGARLKALRDSLKALSLDGLLVPRADIFQGEYLPASEDRLAWLTGFSGSAGFAIVLGEVCALFVDGRYTVQARDEVDANVITVVPIAEQSPEAWLKARGAGKIGYDPALFTDRGLTKFESTASSNLLEFVPLHADPFAPLWPERPPAPATPVVDHPLPYAGESREAKLARLQAELAKSHLDALVVSENPAVNWLFNIRAADVEHLPILRAFALVPREGKPTLFVDPARLEPALAKTLADFAHITPAQAAPGDGRFELVAALTPLAKAGAKIRLDAETAPVLLAQAIEAVGGAADIGTDPIARMKAAKNAAELAGTRAAHLRDGVAVTRFLAWLEARQGADEIDAVVALENFRIETGALHDLSFGSIAGAGPNAALPHYRVTQKTNRPITPGLFLVDSGGQYRDGTTDITRTVQIGRANKAMREAYTRVLKGMIAVSLALFPKGASGAQLDTLARQYLWAAGQDFDHGTGHGVGSFLSVHEGPQRISKFGSVTLEPGMILSNEPGYYREGAFGIRIENLVVVEAREEKDFEREMLGFETLTLAPIDTRPVIKSWLSRAEKGWLNAYHARVEAALSPHLDGEELAFLKAACAKI